MKILSMPAAAGPTQFTDSFTVTIGQTVARTLGMSPKNSTYRATIRIAFSSASSVSSASFNNSKLTVGGVDTNLWGHQTSSTTGSVTYVDFEITGVINKDDVVVLTVYNPSSSITRTVTVDVTIA